MLLGLDEVTWAGIGAVCAGIGSLMSGIGAYKLSQQQRKKLAREEEELRERQAGGADR
jgi:hypothetical protein